MRGIVYSEVDPSQRGSLSDGLDVLGWLIALRLVAIAVSVTTAKVVNEAGVRAPCLLIAPGAYAEEILLWRSVARSMLDI